MTASSMGWMPLFFSADPHRTGTILYSSVPARSAREVVGRDLLALEELVGDVVVEVGQGLDHLVVPGRGPRPARRGSRRSARVAQVAAVGDRLHLTRSMTPRKFALEPIGIWTDGDGAQPVLDHVDHLPEVGAGAVELVDEAEARHAVAIGLAPDGLGLRLDAGHAVEDDDRAVEHAQAALDLDGEIHVPGRVDKLMR